jgi:hypothetical protein
MTRIFLDVVVDYVCTECALSDVVALWLAWLDHTTGGGLSIDRLRDWLEAWIF